MLVLSRRIGEKLVIGEEIRLVVLGVNGSQIRVGVEAPRSVDVHREEVYQRIQKGVPAKKAAGAGER